MAVSSYGAPGVWRTPDVTISWAGFEAPAWVLQRQGWEFEEIVDPHDYLYKRVALRHRQNGWTGIATCCAEECIQFINTQLNMYSKCSPTFVVQRMVNRDDRIVFERSLGLPMPTARGLDFEPAILEMRRFTLADILPARVTEEIIVEPETVAGLLDRIKQMQAPELARIREENRKRAAREAREAIGRMREVRHATILTLSEAT